MQLRVGLCQSLLKVLHFHFILPRGVLFGSELLDGVAREVGNAVIDDIDDASHMSIILASELLLVFKCGELLEFIGVRRLTLIFCLIFFLLFLALKGNWLIKDLHTITLFTSVIGERCNACFTVAYCFRI